MKRGTDILPNYAVFDQPPVAPDEVKYDNRAIAVRSGEDPASLLNATVGIRVNLAELPANNQAPEQFSEGYAAVLGK